SLRLPRGRHRRDRQPAGRRPRLDPHRPDRELQRRPHAVHARLRLEVDDHLRDPDPHPRLPPRGAPRRADARGGLMPGRYHLGSQVSSAWWGALGWVGVTPEGFHAWPGWQQRLGQLAVGGVVAFLISILVNVLEASFGSTGSTSIFTFDGTAYLAFLVVGLIYVPEWSKVPLLGKIAIPL